MGTVFKARQEEGVSFGIGEKLISAGAQVSLQCKMINGNVVTLKHRIEGSVAQADEPLPPGAVSVNATIVDGDKTYTSQPIPVEQEDPQE